VFGGADGPSIWLQITLRGKGGNAAKSSRSAGWTNWAGLRTTTLLRRHSWHDPRAFLGRATTGRRKKRKSQSMRESTKLGAPSAAKRFDQKKKSVCFHARRTKFDLFRYTRLFGEREGHIREGAFLGKTSRKGKD